MGEVGKAAWRRRIETACENDELKAQLAQAKERIVTLEVLLGTFVAHQAAGQAQMTSKANVWFCVYCGAIQHNRDADNPFPHRDDCPIRRARKELGGTQYE